MKIALQFISLVILIILALTACESVTSALGITTIAPTPTLQETQIPTMVGEAQVQSVKIQIKQTDPVQVNAIVRGYLTESCAKLTDPQTSYANVTFSIKILAVSPTDRGCIQITTPYEKTIPINTADLKPGAYTVIVNGIKAVFTLNQ